MCQFEYDEVVPHSSAVCNSLKQTNALKNKDRNATNLQQCTGNFLKKYTVVHIVICDNELKDNDGLSKYLFENHGQQVLRGIHNQLQTATKHKQDFNNSLGSYPTASTRPSLSHIHAY